ncbi:transposase is4 [Holotrichia oblita]|uniref:Transposase is4 n=1 Tax=Holotrichia oblita TaxID=644536 RepID=A0ACB9T7Y0_HOLOL|nr:transposase is4 [Holotrichia oblita]
MYGYSSRKRLDTVMQECVQNFDMSDEEPYTAESDDDPDFKEESENDESEQKIIEKQVGASLSTVVSDSEVYSNSRALSEVESRGDDSNSWALIVKSFEKYPFNIPIRVPVNLAVEIQDHSELDIFLKIGTDGVFELMAVQTNIYAEQKIIEEIVNETVCPKSILNEWIPTSAAEIKKFLGIIIWMGLDCIYETMLYQIQYYKTLLNHTACVPKHISNRQ